jgi:polyhydroxybutyrate depolymerase
MYLKALRLPLLLWLCFSTVLCHAEGIQPLAGQQNVFISNPAQVPELPPAQEPYRFNRKEGATIDETLVVDALIRRTLVHLPAGWQEDKTMPLLIILHGAKLSGKIAEVVTGFDKLSNKENFIVAYPDAVHHQWNDGRNEWDNPSYGIDDVKFISRLMDYMVWKYHVNPQKIYVAGYSSGGMLAQRLAMEITDKVAAIAEVAATLPMPQLALKKKPGRPISVLMINGTEDPAFPWGGGTTQIIGVKVGNVASVLATVDYWINANGGMRDLPDLHPAVTNKRDGTMVDVANFPTQNKTSVMLYTIRGGGHTWPGSDVPLRYIPFLGRQSGNLKASELIWEFFSHY